MAEITNAHQDGCGNTMSIAEGHVSMTKRGARDVGAINAKGFAFVTRVEGGHGLGRQITGVLMVESSAQCCPEDVAEGATKSDDLLCWQAVYR